MPSKADVICIPPVLLGAMWPTVGQALLGAHIETSGCDLRAGLHDLHETCAAVLDGVAQLWAMVDDDKITSAWLTKIETRDAKLVVVTSTIPARVMDAYGDPIRQAMAKFAHDEGAEHTLINRTSGAN